MHKTRWIIIHSMYSIHCSSPYHIFSRMLYTQSIIGSLSSVKISLTWFFRPVSWFLKSCFTITNMQAIPFPMLHLPAGPGQDPGQWDQAVFLEMSVVAGWDIATIEAYKRFLGNWRHNLGEIPQPHPKKRESWSQKRTWKGCFGLISGFLSFLSFLFLDFPLSASVFFIVKLFIGWRVHNKIYFVYIVR